MLDLTFVIRPVLGKNAGLLNPFILLGCKLKLNKSTELTLGDFFKFYLGLKLCDHSSPLILILLYVFFVSNRKKKKYWTSTPAIIEFNLNQALIYSLMPCK